MDREAIDMVGSENPPYVLRCAIVGFRANTGRKFEHWGISAECQDTTLMAFLDTTKLPDRMAPLDGPLETIVPVGQRPVIH